MRHRLDPRLQGLPVGQRVYAVGDVHGHVDRLRAIHRQVASDLRGDPCGGAVLVHLGDFIDRGPDSSGVLAHLLAGPPVPGLPVVNLTGNHEALLLAALEAAGTEREHEAADDWLRNGGLDTLRSWGIPVRAPVRDWAGLMPPGHLGFVQGLLPQWSCEGALFVHAGVRPGIPLDEQDLEDLLWIREPFLRSRGVMLPEAPGTLVVHGHTPAKAPELKPNRLGLDTGAGRGGPLTCAVLEGDEVRFMQG